jgi:hypothetical protein
MRASATIVKLFSYVLAQIVLPNNAITMSIAEVLADDPPFVALVQGG